MVNVNDHFFDGQYKDIWKAFIPEQLTIKEVDFLIQHFSLGESSSVLDIMSGYGRHAIALAQKNIHVTAIDNLPAYTDEIRQVATAQQIPVEVITDNIATCEIEGSFDLAICMGNSLNFFPEHDIQKILTKVAASLRSKGSLLIHSWSVTEIAVQEFKEKSWTYFGDTKILSDSKFQFQPTRLETETLMMGADGTTEIKMAVDYIFSIAEMERILKSVGFSIERLDSIPGKKRFALGDPRIYIIARKNN